MAKSPTFLQKPDSRRSSTSTILYSQEPYDTFSLKVMQLLQGLYPDCKSIVVERMAGGGYNRIVGATLTLPSTSTSAPTEERIVIRVPRFNDNAEVDSNIAVLLYLSHHHHSSIPVPHILHYDLTDTNPIKSVYMIQKYVVGTPLEQLLPALTPEERLEIATELAEGIARICTTTFEHFGTLCAISKGSASDSDSTVGFAMPPNSNSTSTSAMTVYKPFTDTLDFLIECYSIHTRNAQGLDANDTWLPGYMEKLKEIARVVHTKRPFSNKFCLRHNDFMTRNVHVTKKADSSRLGIAAIFDWDGTTSAPIEAAYVAPHWLWNWSPEYEEGREEMEMADAVPESADLREAKERFEEEMELRIPGFMSIWREGFAARELFYFAINGLVYQDDAKRIDRLAKLDGVA